MGNSSFTLDQLQRLEEAISQGALTVKYSDKEVTYRDFSDMMKIRDLMRKDLGLISGQSLRLFMRHCKGLN